MNIVSRKNRHLDDDNKPNYGQIHTFAEYKNGGWAPPPLPTVRLRTVEVTLANYTLLESEFIRDYDSF